jgi:hypothetical protein
MLCSDTSIHGTDIDRTRCENALATGKIEHNKRLVTKPGAFIIPNPAT